MKWRTLRRAVRKVRASEWRGLAFVLPILALFLMFRFWPLLEALWLGFHQQDLLSDPVWVGLANYKHLFSDPVFLRALRVTAYYTVGTCVPLWVLSLGLALLLDCSIRARGVFRTLIFLPAIVPGVVLPVLWRFLLHPYGLVNEALGVVGIGPVQWLTSTTAVIPAFILANEWRLVPMFAIIYLAGLQGVPREYHEAAQLDGASYLRRFWSITLPLLKPTIAVVVIVSVTLTSRLLIMSLLMTEGGPAGASRVLSLFIFETGFEDYRLGYASAASMVLLVIMLLFTVAQLRMFRPSGEQARLG